MAYGRINLRNTQSMGIPQMIITILGIFPLILPTSYLLWIVLDDKSSNFNKACYLIGNTGSMNIYRKTEMIPGIYGGLSCSLLH